MTKDQSYPAMKWDPKTKESRVFNKASEVPAGWLDTHPDNVKNVIEATAAAAAGKAPGAPGKDQSYPAMKWDPVTKESRVFNKASEVPDGWLDTHPDNLENMPQPVKAPEVQAKAVPLPLTRKEMVQALQDGGIPFDPASKVDVLYAILTEAVKKFLTDADIAFDPAADTKVLLGLLPKPE